jgi:hypothetical protein
MHLRENEKELRLERKRCFARPDPAPTNIFFSNIPLYNDHDSTSFYPNKQITALKLVGLQAIKELPNYS